jgi:hypothetical protein
LTAKRKRTEIDFSDPYQLLDTPHFPGYAETLRQLGALDGLDDEDARQVVGVIMTDQMQDWAVGPREPRDIRVALQQRAANVGCGSDLHQWVDRSAVSRALGIAADALTEARPG